MRKLIPLLAVIIGTFGCAGDQTVIATGSPRPILILDIDTLRADHLGCYGYERSTSPNLDRLAEESVVFEWAFSQAPNTPPSQSSIFTGLYPSTHGMIFDENRLPDAAVTLAEALSANGWKTVGFHDGGYMSPSFNMDQGYDAYHGFGGKGLAASGPKAISWMERNSASDFLLLLHTYDTHTPYAPPDTHRALFLEGLDAPTPGFEPTSEAMEAIRSSVWTDEPRSLAKNDLEYAKALYDAEIRWVDDRLAGFLDAFHALGLDERAILVVISDHGEEFQEHGNVLHEKLYATVTHIPLMIRLPGGSRPQRIPHIVESIDVMPTLLELVGVEIPQGVQGRSLVPLMTGGSRADARAFGESPFFGERRFIARSDWRLLITRLDDRSELYRLLDDPSEQTDLGRDHPELLRDLRSEIDDWEARVVQAALLQDAPGSGPDEETRDQLRALGYVE